MTRWLAIAGYVVAVAIAGWGVWHFLGPWAASWISIGCWSEACKAQGYEAGLKLLGTLVLAALLIFLSRRMSHRSG